MCVPVNSCVKNRNVYGPLHYFASAYTKEKSVFAIHTFALNWRNGLRHTEHRSHRIFKQNEHSESRNSTLSPNSWSILLAIKHVTIYASSRCAQVTTRREKYKREEKKAKKLWFKYTWHPLYIPLFIYIHCYNTSFLAARGNVTRFAHSAADAAAATFNVALGNFILSLLMSLRKMQLVKILEF